MGCKRPGFNPWVRKIPGKEMAEMEKEMAINSSSLENPMDRGAVGLTYMGSQTTEHD